MTCEIETSMKTDLKDSIIVVSDRGLTGEDLVADLARKGQQKSRAFRFKPLDEWHQHFPDVENLGE